MSSERRDISRLLATVRKVTTSVTPMSTAEKMGIMALRCNRVLILTPVRPQWIMLMDSGLTRLRPSR